LIAVHVSSRRKSIINRICLIESISWMNTALFVLVEYWTCSFTHSKKRLIYIRVHIEDSWVHHKELRHVESVRIRTPHLSCLILSVLINAVAERCLSDLDIVAKLGLQSILFREAWGIIDNLIRYSVNDSLASIVVLKCCDFKVDGSLVIELIEYSNKRLHTFLRAWEVVDPHMIFSDIWTISLVLERSRVTEVLITILGTAELNEADFVELDVRVFLGRLDGEHLSELIVASVKLNRLEIEA